MFIAGLNVLTVGRYGRYGNPQKSSSVHPRHARALTVGRYGRYGKHKNPIAGWMQGGGVGAAGIGYLEILKMPIESLENLES